MADILTPPERSAMMAKVRSAGNVSTELRLVAIFRALGITGWRRGAVIRRVNHRPTKMLRSSSTSKPSRAARPFQVRPDFVFPKHRLAVFVDGCFWHGCPVHATKPKQNAAFWIEKIAGNRARDRLVNRMLRVQGWRVLRLWEHELNSKNARALAARLRRCGLLQALHSVG